MKESRIFDLMLKNRKILLYEFLFFFCRVYKSRKSSNIMHKASANRHDPD